MPDNTKKTLLSGLKGISDSLGNLQLNGAPKNQSTVTPVSASKTLSGSTYTPSTTTFQSYFNGPGGGASEQRSIMDAYKQAREQTSTSRQLYSDYLHGELEDATTDLVAGGERTLTNAQEGQSGFAKSPLALSMIASDVQKSIDSKQKQIAQMELAGRSEEAAQLSKLIIDEQSALSAARTRALDEFFKTKEDQRADAQIGFDSERLGFDRAAAERDALSFRTPEQQAVLRFASAYPDAGITDKDTLDTVQGKIMNSPAYKNATAYQKAQIESALANAAQSRAATAATYAGMSKTTGSASDVTDADGNIVSLTASQKSKLDATRAVLAQVANYRKLVDESKNMFGMDVSSNLAGQDAARLRAAKASLEFAIAQAVGTGALQAADRAVVQDMVPNLTSWSPLNIAGNVIRGGKKGELSSLDEIAGIFNNNIRAMGVDPNQFTYTLSPSLSEQPVGYQDYLKIIGQ